VGGRVGHRTNLWIFFALYNLYYTILYILLSALSTRLYSRINPPSTTLLPLLDILIYPLLLTSFTIIFYFYPICPGWVAGDGLRTNPLFYFFTSPSSGSYCLLTYPSLYSFIYKPWLGGRTGLEINDNNILIFLVVLLLSSSSFLIFLPSHSARQSRLSDRLTTSIPSPFFFFPHIHNIRQLTFHPASKSIISSAFF
jgi:hypothetical protein